MEMLKKYFKSKPLLNHTLIKKNEFYNYRLSLDVMLPSENWVTDKEKPPKEELERLSRYLYKKYKGKKYDRVFICYYLLGMVVDNGAWASGHFNPDLEIKILKTSNIFDQFE